ncbi:hypothetical protein EAE96_003863 [Botrytis aclada]|nr:hypothetical protein EAE96_003863 [Botrytis aclada]
MAPPDETSVKEVPAPTKDAAVEKADEQEQVEEEDSSTIRSTSPDNIGVNDVNQEVNQEVNQGSIRGSKSAVINTETSEMGLMELDTYIVRKLAEAGFVRTRIGASNLRRKNHCEVDYSKVCDLVANMPESIRAMETRENLERSAAKAREPVHTIEARKDYERSAAKAREPVRAMEAREIRERSAAKASEPVRRRSTVFPQSVTSLQERDTLNKLKNSQFAINGKRNWGAFTGSPARESTNAATATAAAASARKPLARAYSRRINGVFHPVTNQQGFLKTSGSKSCEVAKTESDMGLNMSPPSKRVCVTKNRKENPIEIRDDSSLGQPQSETRRIELAGALLANLKEILMSCDRMKDLCGEVLKTLKVRSKEVEETVAEYHKKTVENVDEMFRIRNLNPEFEDYHPFR